MQATIRPKPLEGKAFSILRDNPDRGFRLETYLTLGSNTVMFHPDTEPLDYVDRQIAYYADTPCHLVQAYVYLTEYCKKPLDNAAFTQLEAYLNGLTARGLRAVLRFAYAFDVDRKIGPTTAQMLSHLKQLKIWFHAHRALADASILVVQAGLIGAWGEWHTDKHWHSKRKVLRALLDTVPQSLPVQVRRQQFRDLCTAQEDLQRIGFHDDYLVGHYHIWNVPKGGPQTKNYQRFVKESVFTLNDGEMPWGRDKLHRKGYIDGLEMLTDCRTHALTSLSLVHNFTEDDTRQNGARWQEESIDAKAVAELGLPFADCYFSENGQSCSRTVFDFLADHLGYQLTVQSLEQDGQAVQVTLQNNGFAAPHGFDRLSLAVQTADKIVKMIPFTSFDPLCLQPGKRYTVQTQLPDDSIERMGLCLQKSGCPACSVRFANAGDWVNGIHWF